MRLRQIEIFHAVYVNGSISAAARALHISQPSVSKVLRHAESQLGYTLFELLKGRLVPTDEAHALFREVDDVFGRIGSLRQAAANLKRGGGGHLRLGVVPSLALEAIPSAIARFRRAHPAVTFTVQTLHHSDVLRALYERQSDIAIAYSPSEHPRLVRRRLAPGKLVLLAPAGTFPDATGAIPVELLEGRDFIDVAASGPLGAVAGSALEALGVSTREVVSVGTYYIAAALVRNGIGVAIVDEFTAHATLGSDVDCFDLVPTLDADVHAVWLEDRPLSVLADKFLDMAGEVLVTSGRDMI
ncbi:MAG: LysR family transcriptional regulator [Proteobacteria bacterium]|nr:LysR family transcriptional regulator [Pseudomonadota bacterium]